MQECYSSIFDPAMLQLLSDDFFAMPSRRIDLQHAFLLMGATYGDMTSINQELMMRTCQGNFEIAQMFQTSRGLCGCILLVHHDSQTPTLYIVLRGAQETSNAASDLDGLAASFFDSWGTTLAKYAASSLDVVLMGHSSGAAIASLLFGILEATFQKWRFAIISIASIPFATREAMMALRRRERLHLWVSLGNEGVAGSLTDPLLDLQLSSTKLFNWNNLRPLHDSGIVVRCISVTEIPSAWAQGARICVVNTSASLSTTFLFASGDVRSRKLSEWVAHCGFYALETLFLV